MQIIALVEAPDHVCCRYRVRAFRDELAQHGHVLECRPLPKTWYGKACIGSDLGHADAVILQRKLLPPWQRRLLRRSLRRLVFDFDDAVFGRDSYSRRGFECRRRQRRFAATMRMCDAVVAGNDWLGEQARAFGATNSVAVIPTCVDPAAYPRSNHRAMDGLVRMTWVGSSSTLRGLERIGATLAAIGRDVANVRLRLICDRFLSFGSLPTEECPWDPSTEALALAGCDIGISSNPDDEWSRGKCGLKVLQYMAAGLPVVATPVGVDAILVQHGVTGFHARTEAEWVAAIRQLAGDPKLRLRMGAAGRERIEREFSVESGARRWSDVLNGLVRTPRAA
jgi:glycosyltransferase involved in cell wall biosynthesis